MDQLQLSQQLIDAVQDALGKMHIHPADKRDALDQLVAFTRHVMEEVERPQPARASAGEAFGIWRPGDP